MQLKLRCLLLYLATVVNLSHGRKDLPARISDVKYEQVIADRYLFAAFANESTAWPALADVDTVWQVVALPHYYRQSAEGVWLLAQARSEAQTSPSRMGISSIIWMSLSTGNTSTVLAEIDARSVLVVSHNATISTIFSAALVSTNRVQLLLCNQTDATSCEVVKSIRFPSILANISEIVDGMFVGDMGTAGWLYIASDVGLHGLDLSTYSLLPYLHAIDVRVSSIAWSCKRQTVFIGTPTKLWIQSYAKGNDGWRFEHIGGLIDGPITALAYSDVQDQLWIGQDEGVTLLSPITTSTGQTHWFFTRLAGRISNPGSYIGRLPLANITTLAVGHAIAPDGRVWLGSRRGVMRFDPNASEPNAWRVFNSARYMPNRDSLVNVVSLAVLNSSAVAVTNKGLAVLRFEMWTLAQKAEHFQTFFDQLGRHDKYGLVSNCTISSWGDSRTCVKHPDDNDGLWTAMYLASQIFRYRATHDSAVKASAWTHFEALELLNLVTGIPGYPGRSFAKRTDFPPSTDWYPSPVYPALQFKGDTSSDEIVGHEFIYPLVHDLLASNDDERRRAYALLFNITNHILTHDWYLVGEKRTRTTWGIWNPVYVNDNTDFQDDRGLNSVEILAYLLQTYAYDRDARFLNGVQLLVDTYQYDVNLINRKMIAVCDNDFSDDELTYLSYFNLVYAVSTLNASAPGAHLQQLTDQLLEYMLIGLDLAHEYVQMEKSPFFNSIYCYVSGQVKQTRHLFKRAHQTSPRFDCSSLSRDGVWYLQRWPLELIDWPQFNSDRLDVQLNEPANCGVKLQSLQALPPDERSTQKWNAGAYDVDDGDGYREEDPTAFLISYWSMRYFDLLGD